MFTIPNAIDVERLAESPGSGPRDLDVLVCQQAARDADAEVAARLDAPGAGEMIDIRIPRARSSTGRARAVAVFVPNPKEGFYLPALEGMALGTLVVCPDCLGNRSYCDRPASTASARLEVEAIVAEAEQALGAGDE